MLTPILASCLEYLLQLVKGCLKSYSVIQNMVTSKTHMVCGISRLHLTLETRS